MMRFVCKYILLDSNDIDTINVCQSMCLSDVVTYFLYWNCKALIFWNENGSLLYWILTETLKIVLKSIFKLYTCTIEKMIQWENLVLDDYLE